MVYVCPFAVAPTPAQPPTITIAVVVVVCVILIVLVVVDILDLCYMKYKGGNNPLTNVFTRLFLL